MSRQRTKLSDKDFKLLKKEGMVILGESGAKHPTFGNHIEDFIKFCVYDMGDTYLKSGISEDFENDGDNIKLNPGNDLRKVGFTRGDYKIKYFFYRRLAGADEVVLTKAIGDQSGIIYSGDPKLTGMPMGAFYIDDEGKVYEGETSPTDGSEPNELDIREYKFFIDEISADKKEVRLAPQSINSDKYKDEFNSLSDINGVYTSKKGFGSFMMGGGLKGLGQFNGTDNTKFSINSKVNSDPGFQKKHIGGILQVEDAFTTGHRNELQTIENPNWVLEGPVPEADLRAYVIGPPEWSEWLGNDVMYSVSNKLGSDGKGNPVPQDAVSLSGIYTPIDYINSFGDLLMSWHQMSNGDTTDATGWWSQSPRNVTNKMSFGVTHWSLYGQFEPGRRRRMYSHRNDLKYFWDFGCGHTEITDTPFVIHTYNSSTSHHGTYIPSVTIMNSSFSHTPDTLLDRQDIKITSVTVGPVPESPPPPDPPDPVPDPPPIPPTSPFDGRMVSSSGWTGNAYDGDPTFYIQSGHKRQTSSDDERHAIAQITGQWDYENNVIINLPDIDVGMLAAIPFGPPIELSGENGISNPNTLTYSIIDHEFWFPEE